jgi:tetratricopeptide (TPR) repeat protein
MSNEIAFKLDVAMEAATRADSPTRTSNSAEDAYRKSLAIKVRLADVAGQASTVNQLGNLYAYVPGRLGEAAAFYRQAADKHVQIGDAAKEGRTRNNLALTLQKLGRLDDARREVLRAIECDAQFSHASEPWLAWTVLAYIETGAGNAAAAAEAKRVATASYLAYRRDGGRESRHRRQHLPRRYPIHARGRSGCRCVPVPGNRRWPAAARLDSTIHPSPAGHRRSGSRDRSLADIPGLDYRMAAEILFLLETLEKRQ